MLRPGESLQTAVACLFPFSALQRCRLVRPSRSPPTGNGWRCGGRCVASWLLIRDTTRRPDMARAGLIHFEEGRGRGRQADCHRAAQRAAGRAYGLSATLTPGRAATPATDEKTGGAGRIDGQGAALPFSPAGCPASLPPSPPCRSRMASPARPRESAGPSGRVQRGYIRAPSLLTKSNSCWLGVWVVVVVITTKPNT